MISKHFAFEAPRELKHALALIGQHGAAAEILAGGMSLVPMMTLGLIQPDVVISLNHLPGLDSIRDEDGAIVIGALARHYTIESHPSVAQRFPVLREAARLVGDVQVRHRGTLGGSLAHADPAANYPPVMLVLGAEVRLQSEGGERSVPAGEFFRGLLQTAREPNELLTEVRIPYLPDGAGSAYVEFHRAMSTITVVIAGLDTRLGLATGGAPPGNDSRVLGAVVKVGPVRMRVSELFVAVPVGMGDTRAQARVLMEMMAAVVAVAVHVLDRLVNVQVLAVERYCESRPPDFYPQRAPISARHRYLPPYSKNHARSGLRSVRFPSSTL